MAILTLRSVKGTQLTNDELDANFTALNADVASRLLASSNLSDLTNAATARSNLGLGSLALESSLKTVNGQSVLGSGNIQIDGGVASFNTRTGAVTLSSSDVTTALGFAPYNANNPSGYITSAALSSYLPLTGGTLSGPVILSGTSPTMLEILRPGSSANANIRFSNSVSTTFFGIGAQSGELRVGTAVDIYNTGNVVLHSGNFSSYALPLSGGTLSGALNMSGTQTITFAGFAGIEYYNVAGTWQGYIGTENNSGNLRYNSRLGTHTWYANGTSIGSWNSTGLNVGGTFSTTGAALLANAFRFYTGGSDGNTAYGDFRTNPATGNSIISAKSNALFFNFDHGTGGVVFCNGAGGTVGTVDASGNANFVGAITQNGSQVVHAGNVGTYALPISGGTLSGTLILPGGQNQLQIYSTISSGGGANIFLQRSSSANQAYISVVSDTLYMGVPANSSAGVIGAANGPLNFGAGGYATQASLATNGTFNATNLTANGDQVLHAGNFSSYALPLSGGTLTGKLTISSGAAGAGGNDYFVAQDDGGANAWRGRILSKSATYDRASFLGIYNGIAGVFSHNNAMTAWADLYINTVDGSGGGTVRMPSSVLVNGNQVLHAGNFGSYALPLLNWTSSSVTLGSRVNSSNFGGNISGMSGNSFAAEVRASGAKPTLTFHYENVATTHIEHLSDGSLNVWRPSNEGTSVFKIGNNVALHAGNFTSYSPSLTGSGASGTWGINVTGSAGSAGWATYGQILDTRAGQYTPNSYQDYRATYEFTNQIVGGGDWHTAMTLQGWHDGYSAWQIIGPASTSAHENWYLRSGVNTSWNPLRTILHSGNFGSYALPLSGGTLTGNRPIEINTNGGGVFIRGDSGGWATGLYFRGSDNVVKAAFGSLGGGAGFSYLWAGAEYNNTWMTWTSSAVNSQVALQQNGNQVLHSGNYNSYSPSLTGGGASGTWGISVSGSAGSVAWTNVSGRPTAVSSFTNDSGYITSAALSSYLPLSGGTLSGSNSSSTPILGINVTGSGAFQRGVRMLNSGMAAGDSLMYAVGQADSSKNMGQFYFHFAGSGSNSNRLSAGLHSVDDVVNIFGSGNVMVGTTTDSGHKFNVAGTVNATGAITQNGNQVLHSGNYNSYSPSLTGGGASGTWGISVSGSAGSVAWTSVSGRPTALSSFTNDSGYITSSGSISGNAATATRLSTASGSAPSYSARAWVNFNGTGTVAIRASGNVSSITDNGTGDYTVNFTTAMADANYAVLTATEVESSFPTEKRTASVRNGGQALSSVRVNTGKEVVQIDLPSVYVAIFR